MTYSLPASLGFADARQGIGHLFVKGLTVEAEIGVWAHEKGRRQLLRLDLDLAVEEPPKGVDDHARVVCYEVVVNQVRDLIASGHFNLVERLADCLAERLLADRRIHAVRIRIEKPGAIRGAEAAGIEIVRLRTPAAS